MNFTKVKERFGKTTQWLRNVVSAEATPVKLLRRYMPNPSRRPSESWFPNLIDLAHVKNYFSAASQQLRESKSTKLTVLKAYYSTIATSAKNLLRPGGSEQEQAGMTNYSLLQFNSLLLEYLHELHFFILQHPGLDHTSRSATIDRHWTVSSALLRARDVIWHLGPVQGLSGTLLGDDNEPIASPSGRSLYLSFIQIGADHKTAFDTLRLIEQDLSKANAIANAGDVPCRSVFAYLKLRRAEKHYRLVSKFSQMEIGRQIYLNLNAHDFFSRIVQEDAQRPLHQCVMPIDEEDSDCLICHEGLNQDVGINDEIGTGHNTNLNQIDNEGGIELNQEDVHMGQAQDDHEHVDDDNLDLGPLRILLLALGVAVIDVGDILLGQEAARIHERLGNIAPAIATNNVDGREAAGTDNNAVINTDANTNIDVDSNTGADADEDADNTIGPKVATTPQTEATADEGQTPTEVRQFSKFVMQTPCCKKYFHRGCFVEWLLRSMRKSCAYCQRDFECHDVASILEDRVLELAGKTEDMAKRLTE